MQIKLDEFQKQAIEDIESGHSVLVSAPTGAGKTLIAEYIIEDCMKQNTRVIYTAPIKALSNQKFRDFSEKYPEKVGILTGDVSINTHAPILIMTTEIFRNKLLEKKDSLYEYAWVIFDEIHYIDDPQRGSVWEESIMFLPTHMKILALSATIPNISEFAKWIENVHHMPIKVIQENNRPVPLHFFFQCQNKIYQKLDQIKPHFKKTSFTIKTKRGYREKIVLKDGLHPNRLGNLINYICKQDELPCIYFSFSRKRCEQLAYELTDRNFLQDHERERIIELFNQLLEKYNCEKESTALEMLDLVKNGIAYHHAGMLPSLKEIIERLFTSRLIKVIFTTETFALGINMPAKTVIFDELRKFYGIRYENLKTRDFFQMAGRAGRRGMDEYGIVFSRINPSRLNFTEIQQIIYGKTEKIKSQFNSTYATILHLYQRYGEKLYDIYPSTLHFYQSTREKRAQAVNLLKNKVDLLKCMKYIEDQQITTKGIIASGLYGYELPLSELFVQGYLESLDEIELNILICGIVFEPRKNSPQCVLSKKAKRIRTMVMDIGREIYRIEKSFKVHPYTRKPAFHIAAAIEGFSKGMRFDQILTLVTEDEGSIVRYFRMIIQILRELLHNSIVSPQFKTKLHRCIDMINRDVVDAERQLRVR